MYVNFTPSYRFLPHPYQLQNFDQTTNVIGSNLFKDTRYETNDRVLPFIAGLVIGPIIILPAMLTPVYNQQNINPVMERQKI